jgi:hypothetical protein
VVAGGGSAGGLVAALGCGRIGGGGLVVVTTGEQADDHKSAKHESENLLHVSFPILSDDMDFITNRRGDLSQKNHTK